MRSERAAKLIEKANLEVFTMMLGTDLGVQPVFRDPQPFQQSEVTGLIGFAGAMGGYVSIHCSHSQAAEFTARLLGADADEALTVDDIRDAIGEIINIVAGTVKRELGSEDPIEIALPTVVMSAKPDMRVRAQTGVVVPFEDPSGVFHVELVMESAV